LLNQTWHGSDNDLSYANRVQHLVRSVKDLKRVDDKNQLSTFSLEQIRQQLNQEILMDADGKNGKFTPFFFIRSSPPPPPTPTYPDVGSDSAKGLAL